MLDFGLTQHAMIIIAVAFLLAGLVKGVIGGGLPAVAVPIMVSALDPALAAALTLVPVAVTNIWILLQGGYFLEVLRRYWTFLLPLAVGSAIGSQILVTAPPTTMKLLIGVLVVILCPLPFIPKNWAISETTQRWLNPVTGMTMGTVGGATVMLAPVIVYFVSLRIQKDLFVASMGAIALSSMTPLFINLAANDVLGRHEALLSVAALLPTALGMAAGIWLRTYISQTGFNIALSAGLLLIGLNLIWSI